MMSSVLEKTWEQTISLLRGNSTIQLNSGINLKHLQQAIIATNRSMHMQSYRNTVIECIESIKNRSQDTNSTLSGKRECLLIIIQLGSIDEKLDFVHPFVIKWISDSRMVFDKLLGYTALGILNQSSRSSIYLAVNTMLKDISSRSSAVSSIALSALASFIDVDLIPVFLPTVEKVLKSGQATVRYKALAVLHAMIRIGPEYVISIWDIMKRGLCDRDPYIMSNCLPIIETLLKSSNPPDDANIPDKVIFILRQVEQGRLPISMMHKGVCGPWIQIRLIRIVRTLPKENYNEERISSLQSILSEIFARFQTAGNLQLAIIDECIRTIAALHPQLQKLENMMLDVIETALSSKDFNALLTGIEMLKIAAKIKPGHSKRYTETLLKTLSFNNETLIEATIELLEDLAGDEDSQKIIDVLVEKLANVSNSKCRKCILSCILKLIEKYPMESKWILEHYLVLLTFCDENDIDFAISKRVVLSFSSLPIETVQTEVTRLCTALRNQYIVLQYCTILDILMFYYEKISVEDAKIAIKDILSNCRRNSWRSDLYDHILLHSLNCIVALSVHHSLKIDTKKEIPNCPFALHQHFMEACLLMENTKSTKSILSVQLSDLNSSNFDSNLSFLDEFSKSHEDSELSSCEDEACKKSSESSNLNNSISEQKKSEFLVKPYSKSRFDTSTSTIDEDRVKKTFLKNETKTASSKQANVWNKNDYKLDNDESEKTEE